MIKQFLEAILLLLFGVSKQDINNFFYSKEWYRKWYFGFYFLKINDNWNKWTVKQVQRYRFSKGEKLQEIRGHRWSNQVICQNVHCRNVINFTGKDLGETITENGIVDKYQCSCCEKVQYFVLDIIPIACDENGKPLEVGMTVEV